MKLCSKCLIDKPVAEFYKNKTYKDGLDHYCKPCRLAYKKERYHIRQANAVKAAGTKVCSVCEVEYPLTADFWQYDNVNDGTFANRCKVCVNDRRILLREWQAKKAKEKEERVNQRNIDYKAEQAKQQEEKVNKIYAIALARDVDKDRAQGLRYEDLKLKKGVNYDIEPIAYRGKGFEGKLIQIYDNHLVFEKSNGVKESFLKADLLTEYEYKEVQNG